MAKENNNVYMVNRTRRVYADLESACENAFQDMRGWVYTNHTTSAPALFKYKNQYKIITITDTGRILSRTISNFVPQSLAPSQECIKIETQIKGTYGNSRKADIDDDDDDDDLD